MRTARKTFVVAAAEQLAGAGEETLQEAVALVAGYLREPVGKGEVEVEIAQNKRHKGALVIRDNAAVFRDAETPVMIGRGVLRSAVGLKL